MSLDRRHLLQAGALGLGATAFSGHLAPVAAAAPTAGRGNHL